MLCPVQIYTIIDFHPIFIPLQYLKQSVSECCDFGHVVGVPNGCQDDREVEFSCVFNL